MISLIVDHDPFILHLLYCISCNIGLGDKLIIARQPSSLDAINQLIVNLLFNTWGWDKIAAISQATFSNASYQFRQIFHWSLVPKGPINNIPVLVYLMTWHRSGEDSLYSLCLNWKQASRPLSKLNGCHFYCKNSFYMHRSNSHICICLYLFNVHNKQCSDMPFTQNPLIYTQSFNNLCCKELTLFYRINGVQTELISTSRVF